MEKNNLGRTGFAVSRLCFGTLTIGPLQAALSLDDGASLLSVAISKGVNFFDTAQLYCTYPYIRRAIQLSGYPDDIVISTKTYAYDQAGAKAALEQARRELDRDYINIFLLHEQEGEDTLRGHREALEYLLGEKARGVIGAVGISTHRVAGVIAGVRHGLDVVHPIVNVDGLGIIDGSRADMETALTQADSLGVGIYSMKAIGGGNLFHKAESCLEYVRGASFLHSVAVGMQNTDELLANIDFFEGKGFPLSARAATQNRARRLHIEDWCTGCGACIMRCGQGALELTGNPLAACVDTQRCIICGYCGAVCPEFAIKIV